jgi:hypothetical protein
MAVTVTPEDRRRFEALVSDRQAPQKHVWRAIIVLATADGCGTAGISLRSVQRILEAHQLAPHPIRTFKLSKTRSSPRS